MRRLSLIIGVVDHKNGAICKTVSSIAAAKGAASADPGGNLDSAIRSDESRSQENSTSTIAQRHPNGWTMINPRVMSFAGAMPIEQRAAQTEHLNAELLSANTRPDRRREISAQLEAIRGSDDWQLACFLIDRANDSTLQFFGGSLLYEAVKNHSTQLLESPEVTDALRKFLFTVLSQGATSKSQSLINKLSSAMALFSMNCVPDIWDTCIYDMTCAWCSEPELLLRVLAEMPIEFDNLKVPPLQRCDIRTYLQRSSESVIRIIQTVFSQADSSPSLSNAAIECVESWMKLPNVSVLEWKPILLPIFSSTTQDLETVARLLNILSSNSDMGSMDNFVLEVAECIAYSVIPNLAEVIRNTEFKDSSGDPLVNLEDEIVHITDLIGAIGGFYEIYIYTLTTYAFTKCLGPDNKYIHAIRTVCSFCVTIASFPGQYPVEECFSHLPDNFWAELHRSLTTAVNSNELIQNFLKTCKHEYYMNLLQFIVQKTAFSRGLRDRFSAEEFAKWEMYRSDRLEACRSLFICFEKSTMKALVSLLEQASAARDLYAAESVFHFLHAFGEMISEDTIKHAVKLIKIATETNFTSGFEERDVALYVEAFLKFLGKVSGCLVECAEERNEPCVEAFKKAVEVALSCLKLLGLEGEGLRTLQQLVDRRSIINNMVSDQLLHDCFAYFSRKDVDQENRIAALGCIGYCLSLKPYDEVIQALGSIMTDKKKLEALGDGTFSSDDPELAEKEFLFELDVYSKLTESIRMQRKERDPCIMLLEAYIPTFSNLISRYSNNEKLILRVTAALKAGLNSVDPNSDRFFLIYLKAVEDLLLVQPYAATNLAQSFLLTFAGNASAHAVIMKKIADWVTAMQSHWAGLDLQQRNYQEDGQEELLIFITGVIKKHWKIITTQLASEEGCSEVERFFEALILYLCDHIGMSCSAEVVRKSASILQTIASKDHEAVNKVIVSKGGELIVATVFARLQSDLLSSIVNTMTEVLQFFYSHYPQETRAVIGQQANGGDEDVQKALTIIPSRKREFLVLMRLFHKRVATRSG
ncbi:hypothetical protein L596_018866 [Steinernema carpocapsae]|uniref:Exportin-1/Importin-beta-like domain-containing protein n=1 Tax=Steinernema carpocapsae TaxID=34508 RepID=A0A4V6A266_STECR|nr:hypothetical protein L596_018866 [Steinernema carpocapsae]